jgi:hypothetical protein
MYSSVQYSTVQFSVVKFRAERLTKVRTILKALYGQGNRRYNPDNDRMTLHNPEISWRLGINSPVNSRHSPDNGKTTRNPPVNDRTTLHSLDIGRTTRHNPDNGKPAPITDYLPDNCSGRGRGYWYHRVNTPPPPGQPYLIPSLSRPAPLSPVACFQAWFVLPER